MDDGFESEDDIYIPCDSTEEDEDSDSDAMPPLIDIGSFDGPAPAKGGATDKGPARSNGDDDDDDEDDDDDMPGLTSFSESAGSDAHSKNGESSEAESEDNQDEPDDAADDEDEVDEEDDKVSSLTWDLDAEELLRLRQQSRLEKLVIDFVVDYVKRNPSKEAFLILTTSSLGTRNLDRLKNDLFDHFLATPHTPHSFSQVLSIFVKEKATKHLTNLISANPSLTSRCPGDMQDAASYFVSLSATNRKQGAKIIMQAMETVIQDMVMEVEFAFRGVRKEAKRVEIMTILKTLKDDERKAAIKLWVDEVITPPPEALSKEVQPQPPVTNFNNPMDVLAAMTALATTPAGNYNDPLGHDLIEMLDVNPSNPEVKPLAQRFRPDFSFLFESWKGVLGHSMRQANKDCGAIGGKLCKDLQTMAPYLQSKLVMVEMKSRCVGRRNIQLFLTPLANCIYLNDRLDSERQGYLKTILTLINRFMLDEVKKAAASRKAAQEGAKESPNTSSGSPPTASPSTSSGGGSSTSPSNSSASNTAPNLHFSPTPGGFAASIFSGLVPPTAANNPPPDAGENGDIPQEYVDMIMNSPLAALFASLGNAMSAAAFGGDVPESSNPVEEEGQPWDSVD